MDSSMARISAFVPGSLSCAFGKAAEYRAGRHGSEAVALRHPVMPVANGLGSGWVGINGDQL
jgi:hypothetical protein